MAHQRANSALAFVAGLDASRWQVGWRPSGSGSVRLASSPLAGSRGGCCCLAGEPTRPQRVAGARDLALGAGMVFASRRGPAPLRGWLLASALADCCDVLAIAGSKSASAGVRAATALVSGLSAGVQVALAGRLIR